MPHALLIAVIFTVYFGLMAALMGYMALQVRRRAEDQRDDTLLDAPREEPPSTPARAGSCSITRITHTGRVECAAPRHDGEPVTAETAAYLCRPCKSALGRDLRHLPALDRDLEQLLDPRKGTAVSRGGGDGLPYHEPAAECISQIRHDLMVWVRWISDERKPDNCPVRTTAAMAGWISGQLRWCTFRSWAGELAAAIAADRGRAIALIDPMPCAEIPIPPDFNYCPACTQAGALYATIYQSPGDRRPSMVTCGECLHEWDTVQWMRLGRNILTWAAARKAAPAGLAAAS